MVPIVLHHGVLGFSNFQIGSFKLSYFSGGIDKAIMDRGHPVINARVHPTAGIATRAGELKEIILQQLAAMNRPNDSVIIIAHSMGGLDSRYMIHALGMAERVRALVTIATPHRGTSYADWCEKNLGRIGGLELAKFLKLDIQALSDLTPEGCRKFNEQVPDSPLVKYYSVSGSKPWYKMPPFALHSWKTIHDIEGDNDCLVSVKSSIWGKHLGTWPVDHLHEINRKYTFDPGGVGDITPYYLKVLDTLKEDGVSME